MKLFNVENIPEFINVIDQCNGKIDCVDAEGKHFDLKDPRGLVSMIHMMDRTGKIDVLEVHPVLNHDLTVILRYAADAGIGS